MAEPSYSGKTVEELTVEYDREATSRGCPPWDRKDASVVEVAQALALLRTQPRASASPKRPVDNQNEHDLVASIARYFRDCGWGNWRTPKQWRALEDEQAQSRRIQAANLIDNGYTAESLRAAGRRDLAALVDNMTAHTRAKSGRKRPAKLAMRDDAIAHKVGWVAAVYNLKPTSRRNGKRAPKSASAVVAKALNIERGAVESIWTKSQWRLRDADWEWVRAEQHPKDLKRTE